MLQTEFKRDMHNNYMVIKEHRGILNDCYGLKMLLNNVVPGLLKIDLRVIDNINQYYYDITSKQPIHLLFEKGQLKREQIKKIMSGIISGIDKGREFLLKENDFVLDPQYIFINLSSFEVSLCHVAGYNIDIRMQLCEVIEYLMNKVDHRDEEAVLLIYGLYKISREDSCTFDKLTEILEGKNIKKENLYRSEKLEEKEETVNRVEPIMKERVELEEEYTCYSKKAFLLCGLSAVVALLIIFAITGTGIIRNQNNGRLHLAKFIGVFIIITVTEVYVLMKILNKKNVETRIRKKTEYIDCVKGIEEKNCKETVIEPVVVKTDNLSFDHSDQTMVLSDIEHQETYKLSPEDKEIYSDIELVEFPFFIGKLKTNVDYTIENIAISRFHAKLERENNLFYLTDLNSTNGTFINEIRMEANEKRILHLEDEVSFANIKYHFTYS